MKLATVESGRVAREVDAPAVPLSALEQLWFQVAGTVCNLRCGHCFISCAPDNHSFWFMSRRTVRRALDEASALGAAECYFTGGEPFMNPEMTEILGDALEFGPSTVLTNGTLLPERRVRELVRLAESRPHPLELRVSVDGPTAEANDAIRGEGAFARAMEGVGRLVGAGFRPIVTTMRSWPEERAECVLDGFRASLGAVGYANPRIKVLPPLRIGEEATRSRAYRPDERVTREMMQGYDASELLCSRARLVTARGVWACPILLDYPSARLGDTLAEAARAPARLGESACHTCWENGAICSNATGVAAGCEGAGCDATAAGR